MVVVVSATVPGWVRRLKKPIVASRVSEREGGMENLGCKDKEEEEDK